MKQLAIMGLDNLKCYLFAYLKIGNLVDLHRIIS